MAKQATRQVSIFLNGKQVENSIKAIAAEQRRMNNELAGMIRGTDEYEAKASDLRKVNGILADHRKSLNGVKEGWSLAKVGLDKFVGVAAGAFTVDAVIGYGKELFNTASRLDLMERKARTVFANTLPQVTKAAEDNARAMGLTNAQYVAAAANIQDLLVPLGFQRKQAAEISVQLTNLSGALSEWSEGQYSAVEVSDILRKALLGEREAMESLGISLREAELQSELSKRGFDKLTGSALEQAKVATTLDLIIQKSQDAQTAYADNADSMARRSAVLSARFEEIQENLSGKFIPVFELLIDVLGAAGDEVDWLTEKFDSPAWKNIGTVLSSVFDTKGTLIRLFLSKDELDKTKKSIAEITGPVANPFIFNSGASPFATEQSKKAVEKAKLTAAEIAKIQKKQEEAREDADWQKRAATQIKRAAELQTTLTDLIAKEDEKRRAASLQSAKNEIDDYAEKNRIKLDLDLDYEKEKADAQEQVRLYLQTDQEAEIEALTNHYATLLLLAEQYGLDTTDLKKKQAADLAALEKKYADEEAARQFEFQQARLAALGSMFTEFGNVVAGTFDLLAGEGERSAEFQKIATLAKIAFDTAAAISSLVAASEANPANAFTFGAAAVAQYAAGIARILVNIGQAKKILAGAPKVQQKYEGRYLDVTGAQDGRAYRARAIAPPATGLLPNYPVLFQSQATGAPVLASERGQEYFVASKDLTHPAVANYVRMIDNIVTSSGGRVRQFADGGSTMSPLEGGRGVNNGGGKGEEMRLIAQNTAVMQALLSALQRGVVAIIPDRTVLDINDRFGKINEASGGYYG